ncbi:MAG: hypothetical protein ACT4SY_10220 [Hyphomicrobiales bacterium]
MMAILRILAGALALCLSLFAADAQAACASRAELARLIAERLPQAKVIVLGAAEARLFLAAFNRMPPPTVFTADEIVIVDPAPDAPALRIVLFEWGCMTRMGPVPRPVVRALLNEIARGGA